MNQFVFWGLWLGFVLYAFILTSPDRPDAADRILRLSRGAWDGISGPPSRLLRLLESCGLGALLAAGAIALAVFALTQGDWPDFWQQWQTSRFIHVMTLDFCALWLLFPVLLKDDMARRGLKTPGVIAAVLALPLVGACLYLALRPALVDHPTEKEVGVGAG